MALRTLALYKGKFIGIESIYTVSDGMQLNIPEKVESLREKAETMNYSVLVVVALILSLLLVTVD